MTVNFNQKEPCFLRNPTEILTKIEYAINNNRAYYVIKDRDGNLTIKDLNRFNISRLYYTFKDSTKDLIEIINDHLKTSTPPQQIEFQQKFSHTLKDLVLRHGDEKTRRLVNQTGFLPIPPIDHPQTEAQQVSTDQNILFSINRLKKLSNEATLLEPQRTKYEVDIDQEIRHLITNFEKKEQENPNFLSEPQMAQALQELCTCRIKLNGKFPGLLSPLEPFLLKFLAPSKLTRSIPHSYLFQEMSPLTLTEQDPKLMHVRDLMHILQNEHLIEKNLEDAFERAVELNILREKLLIIHSLDVDTSYPKPNKTNVTNLLKHLNGINITPAELLNQIGQKLIEKKVLRGAKIEQYEEKIIEKHLKALKTASLQFSTPNQLRYNQYIEYRSAISVKKLFNELPFKDLDEESLRNLFL